MEWTRIGTLLWVGVVAVSGCDSDSECEGAERCACYRNGTCDQGLECLSELCVADPDGPDAGGGNASGMDAVDDSENGIAGDGNSPPVGAGGDNATGGALQQGSGSEAGTGGVTSGVSGGPNAGGASPGSAGQCAAGCGGATGDGGAGAAGGGGAAGSSGATGGSAGAGFNDDCAILAAGDSLSLPIVFRDFKGIGWEGAPAPEYDAAGHADFENEDLVRASPAATLETSAGIVYADVPAPTRGLVNTLLGSEQDAELAGKPMFRSTGAPVQLTSAATFHQWYVATPGVNQEVLSTLELSSVAPGAFRFASDAFYPIDEAGLVLPNAPAPGPEVLRPIDWLGQGCGDRQPDGQWLDLTQALARDAREKHNYSFSSEVRFWFEFQGGEQITFVGDDDAWLFIDDHLVMDLGGLHDAWGGDVCGNDWSDLQNAPTGCTGLSEATVDVDGTPLGLMVGNVYEAVLFHAERHTCLSKYRLELAGFSALSSCDPNSSTPMVPDPVAEPEPMPPEPTVEPEPTAPEPAMPGPSGIGNALITDDMGWVSSSTNGLGIQGGWFSLFDNGGSTAAVTITDGEVCLDGTTARLVTDGVQWGAAVGLVLNDGGAGVADAWDGSGYTGFSFDLELTMSQPGAPATVQLLMASTDGTAAPPHEKTITSGANTVTWTTAMQPSWAATMISLSPELLTKLQFAIGTTSTGSNAYTLCISNLSVL